MTLFFNIGGVDVPANTVRLVGAVQGLTTFADGSVGTGAWEVDDPAGAYSFLDLQLAKVTETACSQPRMHTGYIYNVAVKRGPYRTGAGRVWSFDIGDLNFLLHLRLLRGATAKRPQESGTARINWLLSSVGMAGLVYDNGLIGTYAVTFTFDATDYTGQYADEVLQNIVAESGTLGRIFFVYYDPPTGQPSLFFMSPAAATNTSTLRISNVLSDASSVTFAPTDGVLARAGEDIYDGVLVIYTGGQLYRQLPSTYTTFGLHRDGILQTSRLNNLTTASANADQFLYRHSGALDTITCIIQVPAAQVNLIDAGMRLQVKFSHLPGYTSFTYVRVTRRTVYLSDGTNEQYDVQLELSIKGVNQTGGGPPVGTFPAPPGCTAAAMSVVQYAVQGDPTVLGATPIVGNTLIWVGAGRTNPVGPPGTGSWTFIRTEYAQGNLPGDDQLSIWYHVVQVGDTTSWVTNSASGTTSAGSKGWMIEIAGTPTPSVTVGQTHVFQVDPTIAITPTAGSVALLLSAANWQEDSHPGPGGTGPLVAAAGMTQIAIDSGAHPQVQINYRVVSAASGPYTVGSTNVANTFSSCAVIGIAFICSPSDNPPLPGAWVYDEVPTPIPDGTTTTFTFANAFADGSMRVKVDLLDQTASIASYDGAAKTVTMLFALKVGEKLTGTYQGR